MLYDAHNHLQDPRLEPRFGEVWEAVRKEPIGRMVVNGTCEADWPEVLALARAHPEIVASFGYHPWFIKERTAGWKGKLLECLESVPSGVGEIGLDRWIKDFDTPAQEQVFIYQLRVAAERNLPASIHCLQAWGRLLEILQAEPRPARGFLLHSYGGTVEMVRPLAKLGAYFSIPGYFAHERKGRQREVFRQVPPDRLLIETDAPDQLPPSEWIRFPLSDEAGKAINHPANLGRIYEFSAQVLGRPVEELSAQVELNFERLFGC